MRTPLAALVLLVACTTDEPVPVTGSSGSGGAVSGSSSSGAAGPSSTSTTGPAPPASTTSEAPSTDGSTSGPGSTSTGSASSSTGESTSRGIVDSCGDGVVTGGEECDCGIDPCTPEGLDFATCADITDPLQPGIVFTGGTLGCNMASCRYDLSACEWGCGDEIIGEGETCEPELASPSCADLGMGASVEPLPCDEACQLDTSSCG